MPERCRYRRESKGEGVTKIGGGLTVIAVGNLRQNFESGLCSKMTECDMGPVACDQPNGNENNCPSLKELGLDTDQD